MPKPDDIRPGPIRIMVVNTEHMLNRVEEFPLDSSAAIIAENKAGKTSLLRLLPFCMGAAPHQIQRAIDGNRNTFDFYFPTQNSVIGFEYRNSTGAVRAVLIYPGRDRAGMRYRFINEGLRRDIFVNASGKFVKVDDLEVRLTELGIGYNARQIDTSQEYREILQGDASNVSAPGRTRHRGLIAEYGIGRASAPIRDIDSLLLKAVENNFSVKNLISSITQKVVETQEDANGNPSGRKLMILSGANTAENRSTASDYKSYLNVMTHEPDFRTAEVLNVDRINFDTEYGRIYLSLRSTTAIAAAEIPGAEANILALRAAMRQAASASDREISLLIEERSACDGRISAMITTTGDIDKTEKRLASQGACDASRKVARGPEIRARIQTVDDAVDALSGSRDKIERNYGALILKAHDTMNVNRNENNHRIHAVRERIDADTLKTTSDFSEQRAALVAEQEARADAIADDISKYQDAIDHLNDGLSLASATDEALAELARQSARLSTQEAQHLGTTARLKDATSELATASAAVTSADSARIVADQVLRELKGRYQELERDLIPESGSFREWIQRHRQDLWPTLSKLLRPEVIALKNLSPALIDPTSTTVFGISIDLEKMPGAVLDEDVLNRELMITFENIDLAEKAIAQAEAAVQEAAACFAKARKAHARAQGEFNVTENTLNAALSAVASAKVGVDMSVAEVRAAMIGQRDAARARIQALKGAQSELRQKIRADERNAVAELARRLAEVLSPLRAEEDELRARILGIEASNEAETARLIAERDAAISGSGADKAAIDAYLAERVSLKADLDQIPALERLAREWTDFTENRIPERNRIRDEINAQKEKRASFDLTIAGLREAAEATRKAAETAISQAEAYLVDMKTLVSRGEAMLVAHQAAEKFLDEVAGELRQPSDIIDIIREIGDVDQRRKKVRNELVAKIRILKSVFRLATGIVSSQYLEYEAKNRHLADGHEWLDEFTKWYDELHGSVRAQLISRATGTGNQICNSYRRIATVESEIDKISRSLRAQIMSITGLPNAAEIDISIRSTIRNQPYYADMRDFTQKFSAWRDTGDSSPEATAEIIHLMDAFFRHWNVGMDPDLNLQESLYLEGQFIENGQVRRLNSKTDLGNISSTGGSTILRQIILTGLIKLIRGQSDVRFAWCVDELGTLDEGNSIGLIRMLEENGISLIVAAPSIQGSVQKNFGKILTLQKLPSGSSTLVTNIAGRRIVNGVREWADGRLEYIEDIKDEN